MTLAATIIEADVKMELWRSFISVLKSYAVLANASDDCETTNLDDTPWSVTWSTRSRDGHRHFCLNVCYDAPKDEGMWRLNAWDEPPIPQKIRFTDLRKSFRPFSLHQDGTVLLEGSVLDMDHAAIQMVAWLTNAVKTGRIEVPA